MQVSNEESVVINAIAANPELSARVNVIADLMLGRIERMVRNGSDQAIMSLAGRIMPALLKAMGDRGQDDDLRRQWDELRAEMRGHQPGAVAEEAVAVEDEAPVAAVGTGGGALRAPEIRVSTKAMRDRKPGKNPPPPRPRAKKVSS